MSTMHKNSIRIIPAGVLGALLLLSPLSFTACDNLKPEISVTVLSDYNGIIQAIRNVNRSLAEKLQLIEAAVNRGFADSQDAQELMRQAVGTLSGTLEEKFAAIEAAVNSQTSGLEAKLGLIETAFREGLADEKAQQELIRQALKSLDGTLEEKLAAIEKAVKDQTSGLETKFGLIEAAVSNGFADSKAKEELILKALEALDGTLEKRLGKIEEAIGSQTTSLETKLQAVQDAISLGLTDEITAIGLVKTAISSVQGDVDEIAKAVDSIDGALKADGSVGKAIGSILTAINGLPDYSDILSAIQKALYTLAHTLNGHAFVELGHFRGNGPVIKWATMNVGATSPQEAGDYFAWGETEPYYSSLDPLTWETGKEGGYADSTDRFAVKIYNNEGRYKWGYQDDIYTAGKDSILHFEHDAAHKHWGASWRTPTQQELIWLSNPDIFKWQPVVEQNVLVGMIVTSLETGYEGNSIFLPVTGGMIGTAIQAGTSDWGYYWSSTVTVSEKGKAQGLAIWDDKYSDSKSTVKSLMRFWGFAIRPVSD